MHYIANMINQLQTSTQLMSTAESLYLNNKKEKVI